MGINIGTLKAVTGDMQDLKNELKSMKETTKANTKQLTKINDRVEKEEKIKMEQAAKAKEAEYSESARFPLVENSPPALGPVDAELIIKKLNIL